ncbi:MAG: pyridoxal 5'-phosphate synthase glutaminase subunit PdxT [Thermoplasmata archaeon]|nr:pyridoxal 5'-phosphate synthase glutaminase subunit PdxT [Thermoplasmata archaeon]
MRIGVVAVQGSVEEHIQALHRTGWKELDVHTILHPERAREMDGLILPGGESTAIARLLKGTGLFQTLKDLGQDGKVIMGTCAGCVLLASRLRPEKDEEKTSLLRLMDMTVSRNAFGRQSQSFETEMEIEDVGAFHGVFIRAPAIIDMGEGCRAMAMIGKEVVMAEQQNLLALSFHPELTDDPSIHRYFLEKVQATL